MYNIAKSLKEGRTNEVVQDEHPLCNLYVVTYYSHPRMVQEGGP